MPTPAELKTALGETLDHIRDIFNTLTPITGPTVGHPLRPPDLHKLTEGLLLSAWSHWEEFCRDLFIVDLSTIPTSCVRRGVREFRTARAAFRLAERTVNHPDHPDKFIEWHQYDTVRTRANELIGVPNRYIAFGDPVASSLRIIYKLRNAIAHKSDKAKVDFVQIIRTPPFNLPPASRRGITVGRFLSAHNWAGSRVILTTVERIRQAAGILVP